MRRSTRRRPDRRPTVYVLSAPRRRSRWGRRAIATLALLVVLGVAAAAVADATSNNSGPPAAVAPSPRPAAPARSQLPSLPHVAPGPPRPAKGVAGAVARVLRYTPVVVAGSPRRRAIALSFDDGPGPYTPKVVQVLSRLHARATFFVVGQQLTDFAAGLRDAVRHGFEIGNHTQNHAWMIRLSAAAQYAQVEATATRVQRLGAPLPQLFRPPYGVFDGRTLDVLRRLHMLAVLWSVDPGDWRRPGASAIVRSVLAAARPGAVVELHDGGGDRSQTVAALPGIITGLHRRHYQLVTVGQLLALDPPPRHQRLPRLGAP